MRVILKPGIIALAPESEDERAGFAAWLTDYDGHVFGLVQQGENGAALHDLGLRADACREPINILFDSGDPQFRPISNLAFTPFVLRGKHYASVEGFWQGLKFGDERQRAKVAKLWGKEAKRAGGDAPRQAQFVFEGENIPTGGPAHHALMMEACRAKFDQNEEARETLLATGDRPLTHRPRRDSKTIPGALLADYWMRIRARLRETDR